MQTNKGENLTRRTVLAAGAGCAVSGGLASPASGAARVGVYEALGVKPVINAAGTLTSLGGSLMPPEVVDAWAEAARNFVDLADLEDKVGAHIARRLGVEAALVTTGAAGAMMVATAAAITRGDPDRIRRLPDTTGMRNEVITQKTHHTCYDHQITNCGAKLIDVETRADLEQAIGDRTAMMLFYNLYEDDGKIQRAEWLEVAGKHSVVTLLDAAADVPPLEALWKYNKMGFDLVAFSGGKALMGPNDTGLLLGRKDLIDAGKLNTAPRCGNIGRMMKVSKEDMVAAWAAVERYMRTDHQAERREWQQRLGVIETAVAGISTVRTERVVPPIANHVPHVLILWDENRVRVSRDQVKERLAQSDPSIAIGRVRGTGSEGLLISVFMLEPGEDKIVAARLREILERAAG